MLELKLPKGTYSISVLVPIKYINYAKELVEKSKASNRKDAKIGWIGSNSMEEVSTKDVSMEEVSTKDVSMEEVSTKDVSMEEVVPEEEIDIIHIEKLITRIIPFVIDPKKEETVFSLLKKVFQLTGYFRNRYHVGYDPKKLATIFVNLCQRCPEIFELYPESYMDDPQTTRISVKDPECFHMLKLYPNGEWLYDVFIRSKKTNVVTRALLQSRKELEEMERKISVAMSNSDISAEAVIAVAYSAVKPEWLFGNYKSTEEIERINILLEKQGLKISKSEDDELYNMTNIRGI